MVFDHLKESTDTTTKPASNEAINLASTDAYSKTVQPLTYTLADTAAAILPAINTTEVAWNDPPRNMTNNERWQYEHMSRDEQWRYNNLSRDQEYTRRHLNSREQYDYDRMTPSERDRYDRDH